MKTLDESDSPCSVVVAVVVYRASWLQNLHHEGHREHKDTQKRGLRYAKDYWKNKKHEMA